MKKHLSITVIILAVAILASSFAIWKLQPATTTFETPAWTTYVNTVYGYQLSYPANMTVSYNGMDIAIPVETSDEAIIYAMGNPMTFQINAYISPPQYIPQVSKRQYDLIAMPLKQFAEAIRQDQIKDKDATEPDEQIGELQKIIFAGRDAYSFTLTETFTGVHGGYILEPKGSVHNFIFVEKNVGVKLMIHYPLNDQNAERIKDSLKFTDTPGSGFVSVGDVLGAMTVVSVKPFNTGQYSPDPKMMQLGPQNIQANLKGAIEVTGAYSAVHSGIGFDGYCMSVSDAASLSRLPVLPAGVRSYFCFRNGETAQQKLGEKSRTITVMVENYQLNSYPAEVVDWADLISVVRQ